MNGFANSYWGWGSEDDDFYRRLRFYNMTLTRLTDIHPSSIEYVRYRTLYHHKARENLKRGDVFSKKADKHEILTDGLVNLKYKQKEVTEKIYYTHVLVELIMIEL